MFGNCVRYSQLKCVLRVKPALRKKNVSASLATE